MTAHKNKNCKAKKTRDNVLIDQLEESQKQIEEKNAIIAKLEQQLATAGTGNTNIRDSVINNNQTINIIEIGKENFKEFLSDARKMKILNQRFNSVEFFVGQIHCSDKFPEFNSIKVGSLTKSHCDIYSKKHNKFIAQHNSDAIEKLVDHRMVDITSFLDIEGVPENTERAIRNLGDKMYNDPNYKKKKCESVRREIYNMQRK